MKWFARILVFMSALVLGNGAAALGEQSKPYLIIPEIDVANAEPDRIYTSEPQGIHVLYAGMATNSFDKETYLKFLVHNGGQEPVHYIGYSPDHSFPLLRANGSDLRTLTSAAWVPADLRFSPADQLSCTLR